MVGWKNELNASVLSRAIHAWRWHAEGGVELRDSILASAHIQVHKTRIHTDKQHPLLQS